MLEDNNDGPSGGRTTVRSQTVRYEIPVLCKITN